MGKWVQLDIDVTSERAVGKGGNSCVKRPSTFIMPVSLSSQYEGELLLPKEIDICTATDVNRFQIYIEKWLESKSTRNVCTGWIINRKIYSREELVKKGMNFPEDASDRYFLTSEGNPVAVGPNDESLDSYLERTKIKLEELKEKEEAKTAMEKPKELPQVVVITENTKRVYNSVNDDPFKRKTASTKTAEKKQEKVIGPDLHIKVQLRTNSANINKSTIYAKVKGLNLTTDFNSDEIIKYFFDESVLRTRFFKHELTPDYDGNPHPGKEIYQTGWIYNGEAYDIGIIYGMGLISPNKAKEYIDSGYSRMAITKCGFRFMMNPEDLTFNEYLEKCLKKDGIVK